ncbi:NTP transferase domain-containing protein, partial [Roseovarius sp. SYSU LYC5161]|uniref:NTP transferase domain-containing protein n=1 Tax=Roseovarius halophilus (ex Wu et al. 2025) TaxID=3376060 RepID=UPI00399A1594
MADLVILLPAAGASARMEGPDKLLEPVDGMPLLRRQVLMALATGAPVLVTLPPGAAKRRAA